MFFRSTALPLGQTNIAETSLLAIALLRGWYLVFGWEQLRWVPFLFSLASLGLCLDLGRRLFKNRWAAWPALLVALSPWSLSVSCQIDDEGGLMAFLALLTGYFYIRFLASDGKKPVFLWLCGGALGLLWLGKLSGLLVLAGILGYSVFRRGFSRTWREGGRIAAAAVAVYSVYPLLFYQHYAVVGRKATSSLNWHRPFHYFPAYVYLSSYAKPLILAGPLIPGALAYWLLRWRRNRECAKFLACLIAVKIALLMYLVNPQRSLMYWSVLLPFFYILVAESFEADTSPRFFKNMALGTGVFFLAFIGLNLGPKSILPLHPRIPWEHAGFSSYINLRIFYGPSLGLFIKAWVLILAFAGGGLLWVSSLKWPRARAWFFGLGLAYAAFNSVQFSYAPWAPSLDRAGARLFERLGRASWPEPVYLHGYSQMAAEMAGVKTVSFMYDAAHFARLLPIMAKTGGTVVLCGAPLIGAETELRRFLRERARLAETISDRGVDLVEVWRLIPST